jgi:hypothetical protein
MTSKSIFGLAAAVLAALLLSPQTCSGKRDGNLANLERDCQSKCDESETNIEEFRNVSYMNSTFPSFYIHGINDKHSHLMTG